MSRVKHSVYYGLMVLLALGALELMSSVFYFQYNAKDPLALIHYVRNLTDTGKQHPGLKAVGIWQLDERYGFSHIAQKVGIHETAEYKATYTIGSNQARITPAKNNARGTILFLGGSYTFGQGVEDDETFPAILGDSYWNQWHIENRAVVAWGTAHALLVFSDALNRESPPSAVIYGMIPHHVTRNYIRQSWVKGLAGYGLKHPHFELVDGVPEYQGVVGVSQSETDSLGVRRKEHERIAVRIYESFVSKIIAGLPR